jgi:hypothetical protein
MVGSKFRRSRALDLLSLNRPHTLVIVFFFLKKIPTALTSQHSFSEMPQVQLDALKVSFAAECARKRDNSLAAAKEVVMRELWYNIRASKHVTSISMDNF